MNKTDKNTQIVTAASKYLGLSGLWKYVIQTVLDDREDFIKSSSISKVAIENAFNIHIEFDTIKIMDKGSYALTELDILVSQLDNGQFFIEFDVRGSNDWPHSPEEYYFPHIAIEKDNNYGFAINGETLIEILIEIIKNSDYGWDDEKVELNHLPGGSLELSGSYD